MSIGVEKFYYVSMYIYWEWDFKCGCYFFVGLVSGVVNLLHYYADLV